MDALRSAAALYGASVAGRDGAAPCSFLEALLRLLRVLAARDLLSRPCQLALRSAGPRLRRIQRAAEYVMVHEMGCAWFEASEADCEVACYVLLGVLARHTSIGHRASAAAFPGAVGAPRSARRGALPAGDAVLAVEEVEAAHGRLCMRLREKWSLEEQCDALARRVSAALECPREQVCRVVVMQELRLLLSACKEDAAELESAAGAWHAAHGRLVRIARQRMFKRLQSANVELLSRRRLIEWMLDGGAAAAADDDEDPWAFLGGDAEAIAAWADGELSDAEDAAPTAGAGAGAAEGARRRLAQQELASVRAQAAAAGVIGGGAAAAGGAPGAEAAAAAAEAEAAAAGARAQCESVQGAAQDFLAGLWDRFGEGAPYEMHRHRQRQGRPAASRSPRKF